MEKATRRVVPLRRLQTLLAAHPALARHAAGVALAVLACAMQWAVRPWVGAKVPFLFILPAVLLAGAWLGRGPSLVALVIGLVNAALWFDTVDARWVFGFDDRFSLVLYLVFGAVLAGFGSRLRTSVRRAADAESQLMLAVENTGIGLFDMDLVAGTGTVSPALGQLVGLPGGTTPVPLEDWLRVLPADAVAESRTVLRQKLRESARSYEREVRLTRENGARVWLLVRVQIVWEGRRATRVHGACVDITERKAVDAQLAQTRAELRQQVQDLEALHELSSRLLDTDALDEQLQMTLEALVDMHGAHRGLLSLFDPDAGTLALASSVGFSDAARVRLACVRGGEGACGLACAARERVVIEDVETDPRFAMFRSLARDEGFRAVHSTPLVSQHGHVLGAISVHLDQARAPSERERALADICARKAIVFIERARAQAALEETQGRYRAVLEASAVPFGVLDPVRDEAGHVIDFTWSYVNGAAARALRRPAGALAGQRVLSVLPARWRQSDAFAHCVAVADEGQARRFETETRDHGEPGWFHCIASPMRGSVALWFADITERKKTEQLLQEADRRKDEFLATLAHELRNPLAPIRQAALLSKAPNATEAQKRWSHEVIERQVQHMALLLDDLLDVSRITRGVLTLRKGNAELAAVIDAAIETARPVIDAKRHTLSVELPGEPVHFQADPLRISQIVANLLTNAAKYTDPGGTIRLTAAREGDEIALEVSDNGIGIAAQSLPLVFEMFVQLGSGGDRSAGGLGIGLALTRGLVQLHGGHIEARSDGPGRGSTFSVRLPVGHVTGSADTMPSELQSPPAVVRRILVADDNRDAAESLALLLKLQGHTVMRAFDGDEALAVYRSFEPDICLLDIGMPGLTGYEVARAIRAMPGGEHPMLVAITGWGQAHDRSRAIAAGFDHHMTKPVDPQRLARLLVADVPRVSPAVSRSDGVGAADSGNAGTA